MQDMIRNGRDLICQLAQTVRTDWLPKYKYNSVKLIDNLQQNTRLEMTEESKQ